MDSPHWSENYQTMFVVEEWPNPNYPDRIDRVGVTWNPLEDDAQALRLAVKLQLVLSPSEVSIMSFRAGVSSKGEVWERLGDDPAAATRRAIVRAAAALQRPT